MIGFAKFIERCIIKLKSVYYKRLFYEKTGQDVSTVLFMGKVDLKNNNIKIGKNVHFRGDCILDGTGPIVIGDNAQINHGTIIYATAGGGVYIGEGTCIAAYCYIIDMDHGIKKSDQPFYMQHDTVRKIIIGNNVWIANSCTILKGSVIHNNAVCAAKTVITGKEIPENAIIAGVPGRVIKYKE